MTGGDTLLLLLRMAVSLALVLGLLVLLARYAARRGLGRASGASGPRLEVLARQQLSRGASMQIVRVADQILLIGVSDAGVRVLTRLSAADLEEGPPDGAQEPDGVDTDVDHARGGRRVEDVLAHQHKTVGTVLGVLDGMITREGRHRAVRGVRRR